MADPARKTPATAALSSINTATAEGSLPRSTGWRGGEGRGRGGEGRGGEGRGGEGRGGEGRGGVNAMGKERA